MMYNNTSINYEHLAEEMKNHFKEKAMVVCVLKNCDDEKKKLILFKKLQQGEELSDIYLLRN